MACKYYLYNEKTGESEEYTYELLIDKFLNGGYKDFSDIVYSRGTKQDAIYSEVLAAKKDFKVLASKNKNSGEPDYVSGTKFTPQTLIDSGHFTFKGTEVIRELSDNDYVSNIVKSYTDDGMSEELAKLKAENTLLNWQVINEDAKELHTLLNSFNFLTKEREDFIDHLEGTKFENSAASIYDLIAGKGGLLHLMRGRHKLDAGITTKVVQGVNLLAKLNHIGEDIIGHIDNLVIDSNGTLHIYNYKFTSTPVSEWNAIKKDKYLYLMALLKLILANNGFNVTGTLLHIIPIRVDYSDDFLTINSTTIYYNNEFPVPTGRAFNKYETMAKYFIKSNVKIEPIKSDVILRINKNLNTFFPERGIRLEGILKSVDEWIKFNYSSKWESRIKRVDEPTHTYEVYFDDEFEHPVLIKDSADPIKNTELREAVTKYMKDVNTSSSEFLGRIMKDILSSKRQGKSVLNKGRGGNRNLQAANTFISKSLSKYIYSWKENTQKVKEFEWEILTNDTLLDANILLLRNNNTDLVDVVVLSDYNLKAKTSFKGLKNIMGSHINDSLSAGLINYDANYANIEAIRAMTILNEVLPLLNQSNLTLGEMKIISTLNGGMMELYDMESLNRDLFLEAVKVIKKNVSDFKFTNNFTKSKYMDPLLILTNNYQSIISAASLAASEELEISDLGFANLENLSTREQKRVELRAIIERIFKLDPVLERMSPKDILSTSKSDPNAERKALANLYILCLNAFCYYSGIKVANEYKISTMKEYGFTQNRVPNKTYQGVVTTFTNTVDDIAYKVRKEYNHIYNFTTEFYDSMGYGSMNTSLIGNLARAFNNLYRVNNEGKRLMEFRNPYKTDTQTPLKAAEKKYLKRVLFEFAKIRSEMYGFDFNFSSSNLDDPSLLRFIEQNKSWYFNPPLERASNATVRANGINNTVREWSDRVKELIRDPKAAFDRTIQGIGTPEEAELMEKTFDTLCLQNSFVAGDGLDRDSTTRKEMLNTHPDGYFETNVENLLAHYLEKHILVREFNKTLIAIKGTLLLLEMLKGTVGEENQAGVALTIKMTQDFTKLNMFNVSIMEPESLKVVAWMHPFRQLVSKAYIAGNIVSMFRDTFEGMWLNTARMLTKYLTDIDAKSLAAAYKEVTKASFTSIRNITIIDELCKTYRLSNLDVARISEGLTTSRGGILNIENWMYATLRAPDFLNRMVLFVAKCMKDGSWEAFDLEDNRLVYNWRKDKRFSVYADESKKGTKEYEELRIAYYNAVRQYNMEHPENTIDFSEDLPVAYSNNLILQMRLLSNSIYGAYDKSMRAKYERTALGISFAMFSTWMNGMITNYLAEPGQYSGTMVDVELDRDGSGNLLFMDKNGLTVVEIDNGEEKQYIYEETGEPVTDLEGMVPIMKEVPRVVLGIWYTIKNSIKALREGGFELFKSDIYNNPMQWANMKKLISDLIAVMLFSALFKYAISPAYRELKKEMVDHSVAENAIAEILYKSTSRSYDGFMGPLAALLFLGENTNPPTYTLSTKVIGDLGEFVFGDKTFGLLMTGNIAFFRSFNDTYKAEVKKD